MRGAGPRAAAADATRKDGRRARRVGEGRRRSARRPDGPGLDDRARSRGPGRRVPGHEPATRFGSSAPPSTTCSPARGAELAETTNGGLRWSLHSGLPRNWTLGGNATCLSDGACVAVGAFGHRTRTAWLDPGARSFHVVATSLPYGFGAEAITCPTATRCVLTGEVRRDVGITYLATSVGTSLKWRPEAQRPDWVVTSIACPSTSRCVGIVEHERVLKFRRFRFVRVVGSTSRARPTAGPAGGLGRSAGRGGPLQRGQLCLGQGLCHLCRRDALRRVSSSASWRRSLRATRGLEARDDDDGAHWSSSPDGGQVRRLDSSRPRLRGRDLRRRRRRALHRRADRLIAPSGGHRAADDHVGRRRVRRPATTASTSIGSRSPSRTTQAPRCSPVPATTARRRSPLATPQGEEPCLRGRQSGLSCEVVAVHRVSARSRASRRLRLPHLRVDLLVDVRRGHDVEPLQGRGSERRAGLRALCASATQ